MAIRAVHCLAAFTDRKLADHTRHNVDDYLAELGR